MTSTIKIKNSSTAGAVPGSGDLVQGELAVNVTDKKIYTKNASGTVVNLGTTPSITDNGNATAITIDSSENVGIGVTPSAWGSPFTALDIGNSSFAQYNGATTIVGYNSYADKYKVSSIGAGKYQITGSGHNWSIAGSGTADNAISFTQAMTLDSSGRLGVGTTSPSVILDLYSTSSSNAIARVQGTTNYAIFQSQNTSGGFGFGIDNSSGFGYGAGAYARVLYSDGAYPIAFFTNSAERMRIDSSGNLLVGTTSMPSASVGGTAFRVESADRRVLRLASTNTGAGYELIQFWNPNGQVGRIETSGSATAYVTSSDYRLKENITPMTGALSVVSQLRPVTYNWKVDGSEGQGFIAHELQSVVPDAVSGEKDAVDDDGNPKYQGIDTSFLVAILTAAIQELNAKFEAYKATHP